MPLLTVHEIIGGRRQPWKLDVTEDEEHLHEALNVISPSLLKPLSRIQRAVNPSALEPACVFEGEVLAVLV